MPLPDPNFPYALDPDDFAAFEHAAELKMTSGDLDSDGKPYEGPDALLRVIRDWGLMINDRPATDAYIAGTEEARKQAHIAELEAELAVLQSE